MENDIQGAMCQKAPDKCQIFFIMQAPDAVQNLEYEIIGGNPCFTVQKVSGCSYPGVPAVKEHIRENSSQMIIIKMEADRLLNFPAFYPASDLFSGPKMGILINHPISFFYKSAITS